VLLLVLVSVLLFFVFRYLGGSVLLLVFVSVLWFFGFRFFGGCVLLLVLVSVLCVVVFCFLVSWWVRVAPRFSFCGFSHFSTFR
jgi:hypothetical protein